MLDQRLPAGPLRLRRGDRLRGGANSDCDEDDWANEVESVSKQNAEYCGDAENDDCFDEPGEPLTCGYCLLVYRLICGLE